MTSVATKLVRMLNLVPYFQANPRITYAEASADLGLSPAELRRELNQLWVCGLPGLAGGDLIDIDFEGDTIEVIFSAGVDHPLRLTSPEATTLLIALHALADVPAVADPEAVRSAIAKIEAAAGTVGSETGTAASAEPEPAPVESRAAAAVREATRAARALRIEYYSASRDTLSDRIVDPIRVVLIANHSYLEAWSREAEGVRLFRFDRIVDAAVLDEPAAAHELPGETDTSLFDADPALPTVTLRLAPHAAWMLEYYPMRILRELPDGQFEVVMTYASDDWVLRLLLGFGSEVTVLEPADLATRVRNAAQSALGAYLQAG
jgi:proteasome accessory factor C